jgi:hypothetical protein
MFPPFWNNTHPYIYAIGQLAHYVFLALVEHRDNFTFTLVHKHRISDLKEQVPCGSKKYSGISPDIQPSFPSKPTDGNYVRSLDDVCESRYSIVFAFKCLTYRERLRSSV